MTSPLRDRVTGSLAAPVHDAVRAFAMALAEPRDDALAVLFYGSNLRTGDLDGVLDFYILTAGPPERGIWPRVSYHEARIHGLDLRAKVATMTLATFAAAASGRLVDTTIWARFCQPSALIWSRDDAAQNGVTEAVCTAISTAARLAVALGPARAPEEDYWRALFRATYAAEFRVEKAGREDSILTLNAAHFAGLLAPAMADAGIAYEMGKDGALEPALAPAERARILRWWRKRQRLGKGYNLVRLLRASTTFEGAARYGAWKIERHTGVPVPLTPWRERHPVLAAPGVLWRVWRARRRAGTA